MYAYCICTRENPGRAPKRKSVKNEAKSGEKGGGAGEPRKFSK